MLSETVTRKGENALTEPKRLAFKPISGLPSEDVPRKGRAKAQYEKAKSRLRCENFARKGIYSTKTWLAKVETCLSSQYVPRKMKSSP